MLREQLPLLIFAMIMALLIIWKHRGNIARLMAGTENRLGSRGA
jgi:acyl phosphate:glycerol-3-phosphate acyltransferase